VQQLYVSVCIIVFTCLYSAVQAVEPQSWVHQNQSDFMETERAETVIDSHGDIKLAFEIKMLMSSGQAPESLSSIIMDGGKNRIYAGSGIDGTIYEISGEKTTEHSKIPATIVTALAILKEGTLLAAGGGKEAGLYLVDGDKVEKVFSHENVLYIWQILVTEESIYLATGPNSRIFQLNRKFDGGEIYTAGELAKNILCLAEGPDDIIYAGTDEKGLVLEIKPKKKSSRVILDADEKEISAILTDGNGGLFASTSDTSRTQDGYTPDGKKDGRPVPDKNIKKNAGQDAADQEKAIEESAREPKTQPVKNPEKEPETKTAENKKKKKASGEKSGPDEKKKKLISPAEIMEAAAAATAEPAQPSGDDSSAISDTSTGGNAVYHIKPDGAVRAIFRRPVLIQDMTAVKDRLVLATGNEGKIYFVSKNGQLAGEIVDTESKQVTSLAIDARNRIFFAAAGKGAVGAITDNYAKKGTLTSKPLDATHISRWGSIRFDGTAPENTSITLATRSGNLSEADDNSWSSWSEEIPLQDGFANIGSPSGRFLQYRVTMKSDGKTTPVFKRARLIYQNLNLQPEVTAIEIQATGEDPDRKMSSPSKVFRIITIKASDPNGDPLKFKLECRRKDSNAWISIEDSLIQPQYILDTRSFQGGAYTLRITASDSPANPESTAMTGVRLSEPVTFDCTPPEMAKPECAVAEKTATVSGTVSDKFSRIARIQYRVDGTGQWYAVLPADGICDSNRENYEFKVSRLEPGTHRISIRITDEFDNTAYGGCDVEIK